MKSWKKKKAANSAEQAQPSAAPSPQQASPMQGHPIPPQAMGAMGVPVAMPSQQMPSQQMPYGGGQVMPQLVAGQQARPGAMPAPMPRQAMPQQGMPQQGMPQQVMPRPAMPQQGQMNPAQMPPAYAQPQQGQMPHQGQIQGQPLAPAHPAMGAPGQVPHGQMSPIQAPQPTGGKREEGELALPAISIHAFCDRPETAGAIQATTRDWRMARTNMKVYMGGLVAAVDFYRSETTPSLILIESGLRGAELFAQLESLASVCDADTKVVVIGATNDIRLYRELMEKGVSDYLVPPFHPLTLIRSLSEIYVDPDKPFTGRVTAFFGAKGGVGSSTMAHNVAWALSTAHSQETSLIDLDATWGTTGLDFNYDNVQGLEEALAVPDRLDETLLDRIMVRHSETLSILPAGASLNNAAMENAEAFEAIIEGIRKISPLAVLDLPHYWSKWTSQTLIGADDVVITAAPDLANLRNAKNLIDFLRSERPNDADPILILNKTGVPKTPEIPVKDFATALGLEPSLVLPFEPVIYAQAANDGKMLADMKTDSKAVAGFEFIGNRLKTGSFELGSKQTGRASAKSSLLAKLKKKKK